MKKIDITLNPVYVL